MVGAEEEEREKVWNSSGRMLSQAYLEGILCRAMHRQGKTYSSLATFRFVSLVLNHDL